jgi:hypothetical protein
MMVVNLLFSSKHALPEHLSDWFYLLPIMDVIGCEIPTPDHVCNVLPRNINVKAVNNPSVAALAKCSCP